MSKEELLKYREFHWAYFCQHADQRLRVFNFYLVVAAILIGAFVNLVDNTAPSKYAFVLPLLLTFISFVFWKLEKRTKLMIKNAEKSIKSIDKAILGKKATRKGLNMFEVDDYQRSVQEKGLLRGDFSYSKSFNCIFLVFGGTGLIISVIYILTLFETYG